MPTSPWCDPSASFCARVRIVLARSVNRSNGYTMVPFVTTPSSSVWGAFDPFVFSEPELASRLASLAIVLDYS